MIKTLTLAAALAVAALSPALAQIEGRWSCVEQMNKSGLKGTITSDLTFGTNGVLEATFNMDMRKVIVKIDAIAKYQAKWKIVNGKLIEDALGITLTRFDVAGLDMRDGDLARDLEADLMRKDGNPPDVVLSGNKLELRQPGRLISCTR